MNERIRDAFLAVRNNNSPDVVIADPGLNHLFLSECRARGLTDPPVILNKALLNLRKASGLQGVPKSKKVSVSVEAEFRFASEIAVRVLDRRDQSTLDQL